MVPKTTTPFTKLIRTGEGVLVYIFGLILIIVPIITDSLPPALATSLNTAKWLTIVTVVARTALKIIGAARGTAEPPSVTPAAVDDATVAEIESLELAHQEFQDEPGGTPEHAIEHGLAPSPEPAE